MSTTSWTKTDYRFVRGIAEGGMGRVDMVVRRTEHFQRVYAMKRLKPGARDDEDLRAMFLDEARLCGLLRHPNVVSVLDVGEDDEGPYMVMEFISGVTAAKLLRVYSKEDELPPVQLCLRIVLDVVRGLAAAHGLKGQNGELLELVHRDLSPQNVLIGFDGVARLSDFGVARAKGRETKTETGILKGKLAYMAPEQVRFEAATRQSDLYALGVVLYELLSARRLYQGSHAEIAKQILSDPPPDIADVRSDVHPSLVALLFQLLAKEAVDRPASAQEVSDILEAILEEEVAAEGPVTISESLALTFREERESQELSITHALSLQEEEEAPPRRSMRLAIFGLVAVLAMALAAIAWRSDEPDPVAAPAAELTPRFAAPRPFEDTSPPEATPVLPDEANAANETAEVRESSMRTRRRRGSRRNARSMRTSRMTSEESRPNSTMRTSMSTADNLRDFGSSL